MKKRIVGLLLVVVMLVLSLASCGYNYSKDDLSQYGSFDKAGFEAAIKALSIEDGDFTEDATTRANKVYDAILKEYATKAGTTDKKTEGKVSETDVLYYCYYITATIGEGENAKEHTFVTDFLASSAGTISEKNTQLGLKDAKDIAAKVIEAAGAIEDFKIEDYAYEKITSDDADTAEDESKAKEGQIAYISYKAEYTKADGKVEPTVVTMARVKLDKANPVHKALLESDKKIGETLADFDLEEEGKGKVKYSGAKINWVEKGTELTTYTEKTYTGETEVKKTDVYGEPVKLNDVELTYHIFPISFIDVEEFNATTLINTLFGSGISYTTVCQVLFGYDVIEKSSDDINKLAEEYKFTEGEKSIDLETFVSSLANLLKTFETEKKDQKTANTEKDAAFTSFEKAVNGIEKATAAEKTALIDAAKALGTANIAVAEAGDKATQEQKDALTAAQTAFDTAKTAAFVNATSEESGKVTTAASALTVAENALAEANKNYKIADDAKNEKVTAFLAAKEGMAAKLENGYRGYIYEKLEAEYNTKVKMNLATEVYALLEKYVTIKNDNGSDILPEKAVDEAYDQLMENYEYAFYNNSTLENDKDEEGNASNKDESYYSLFKGSFKNFIIKCVVPNEYKKTVNTYAEAKEVIRNEGAKNMVKPVLRIYIACEAYGLVLDDKAFEARTEEDDDYLYNEAYYGENTVRNTYQFDDLMNHILANENAETDLEASYANAKFTKVNYKNVVYTIKEKK